MFVHRVNPNEIAYRIFDWKKEKLNHNRWSLYKQLLLKLNSDPTLQEKLRLLWW